MSSPLKRSRRAKVQPTSAGAEQEEADTAVRASDVMPCISLKDINESSGVFAVKARVTLRTLQHATSKGAVRRLIWLQDEENGVEREFSVWADKDALFQDVQFNTNFHLGNFRPRLFEGVYQLNLFGPSFAEPLQEDDIDAFDVDRHLFTLQETMTMADKSMCDLLVFVMEVRPLNHDYEIKEIIVRDENKSKRAIALRKELALQDNVCRQGEFIFMRRVENYQGRLSLWPKGMVVSAPRELHFEVSGEAVQVKMLVS